MNLSEADQYEASHWRGIELTECDSPDADKAWENRFYRARIEYCAGCGSNSKFRAYWWGVEGIGGSAAKAKQICDANCLTQANAMTYGLNFEAA